MAAQTEAAVKGAVVVTGAAGAEPRGKDAGPRRLEDDFAAVR